MSSIIGTLVMGLLVGFGGRAVLPGAQDIGLGKTLLLGVASAVIVGVIFRSAGTVASIVLGSLVAAGLLWLAIRQGWLHPNPD